MLGRSKKGKKVAARLRGRRAVLGSRSIGRQRFGSAAAGRHTLATDSRGWDSAGVLCRGSARK
eukprot:2431195-Prymnesium_polylepis.1